MSQHRRRTPTLPGRCYDCHLPAVPGGTRCRRHREAAATRARMAMRDLRDRRAEQSPNEPRNEGNAAWRALAERERAGKP
jgi:hypothetical protein